MDSDFNRPMIHQPEVLNIKTKEDVWKQELGLDDADIASSTSSEDEENHPPLTVTTQKYTKWSKDKEEMMQQMKEGQKELLKQKREMKELEHQQQKKLKIAKKAYSESLAEKNIMIKELEEHIADKDEIIESLKKSGDVSRSPLTKAQSSLKKIINNISRLQDEKQKLLTKYENAMDEIEKMKIELKEESKQYIPVYNTRQHSRPSPLVEEVAKLKQRVAELEESQQQMQEASVQTDTEKELERIIGTLSSELEAVKKERDDYLTQLKKSQTTEKDLREKVSQSKKLLTESDAVSKENTQHMKCQLESHVQKIEELTELVHKLESSKADLLKEQERLKLKYDDLQVEMVTKEEEFKRIESKLISVEKERSNLSSTVSSLTASLSTVTSEMNEKLSSLQDQGQASMVAYEAKNNSLRSTNASLTAELSSYKRDAALSREGMERALKESEILKAELTAAKGKEEQLLVQIQALQDECATLRGVEEKKSSMEAHMMSLQSMLNEKQQKNEQLQNKLAKTERSCRDALAQKEMEFARTCKANQKALELTRQQAKMETMIAVRRLSSTQMSLSSSQEAIFSLRRDITGAVSSLGDMKRLFQQEMSCVMRKVTCAISDVSSSNKNLVQKYHREMAMRKKLHNQVVELKGNIRVLCRVRPPIAEDGSGPNSRTVVAPDTEDDSVIRVLWKGQTKSIEVDKVFGELSTQEQVFDEVRSLVTSCMDGYNVCIFAYGQTGSGKTYTMEGPDCNPGINKRAMSELFDIACSRQEDWQYSLSMSMTEIYNEQVHDLLGSNPEARLDIKQGSRGNFVQGLTWMPVQNTGEINEVFAVGHKNRATAATNMNIESSRSHALLCIKVTGKNLTTGAQTLGKLNLIDLAGSERVSKSQAKGDRLKEAQSINKSLSALGDVIHSLRSKGPHVPYRNSKLTYLLQDSLSGDSKTLMVVQVAPVEKNVGETMCSLMFAERVRAVELGRATARKETAEIAALKEKLKEYEAVVKGYRV